METLKILVMNWRDISHPKNGGAEVHINEIIRRWVKWGHDVTLLCGGYEGCSEYEVVEGIEIVRRGGPFSYQDPWFSRRGPAQHRIREPIGVDQPKGRRPGWAPSGHGRRKTEIS